MSPIRMAGVKKVAQSLAEANLLDCTLKAWIWGGKMEKHQYGEASLVPYGKRTETCR